MKSPSRLALLSVAIVNLVVAVILVVELWGFYRLDRSDVHHRADEQQKTTMLRDIHYWGIPPVALLTITSGLWLWRLSKEVKP
jgi:hypothetical protein